MNDPQVEIAKEWLSERGTGSEDGRICVYMLKDYIARLEAELKVARADSERLEELELALKEGDVCHVTASERIGPGKYKYIEIEFDSDRNPVSRESLAEAIDEAMEEPEDLPFDGLDR